MNYFGYETSARRYAAGRPFFHPIVLDMIRSHLPAGEMVARAIDVACGTGQSTRILTEIAGQVTGTDVSEEMLAQAFQDHRINYVPASAEALPFPESSFELMTVALAFHWFNRELFLSEARRVLAPGGLLIIYNHAFAGEMACNSAFARWNEDYLRRYPSPPRDARPLAPTDLAAAGFVVLADRRFTHPWPFSLEELVDYLITQSNVIAAVESGRETIEEVRKWIRDGVGPCFLGERESFRFKGSVQVLQRAAPVDPGLSYPRTGTDRVGDLIFLPRMLDKIRLHEAGRLPPDYNLGGGLDTRLCRFLGVAYDEVVARVKEGLDDEALLAWCHAHGRKPSEEEVLYFNAFMLKRGWRDEASVKMAQSKAKRGIAARDDVQTTFDLQDFDEGRR